MTTAPATTPLSRTTRSGLQFGRMNDGTGLEALNKAQASALKKLDTSSSFSDPFKALEEDDDYDSEDGSNKENEAVIEGQYEEVVE